MPGEKADYDNDDYVTEHKHTRYRTWYLSPTVWNRVVEQANAVHKRPRILVCFRPVAGIEYWWEIVASEVPPQRITKGFLVHAEDNSRDRRGVCVRKFSPLDKRDRRGLQ
jgi:hypothetical protein